jgi:hypothetical protein
MPRLQAAVDEAQQKEKAAHDELRAASQERVNAEHARLGASCELSLKLSNVEAEIKKAAPREIDDFVWEMLKVDEKARLELDVEQRPGPKARITGHVKNRILYSNRAAVEKKRAYIKAATAEAEAMKLQAIPHDQIIARLEELKAGIPDGYRFETITAPLSDVNELQRVS